MTQEIWGEISQITADFSLLECDKCAIDVMEWLNRNNVPGKVLKLRAKRRSDLYIISDRVVSNESITENELTTVSRFLAKYLIIFLQKVCCEKPG